MSTELTPQQKFEDSLKNKVRDSIGDLMPEEALTNLIERSIEENFFKERTKVVSRNSYDTKTETQPSVFNELIEELMAKRVDDCIKSWLNENKDDFLKVLDKHFEKSAEDLVLGAITSVFSSSLNNVKYQIESDLFNRFNNQ